MRNEDELKEKVIEQFSRNADKYVTSSTHAQGDDLDVMVEWLAPQKDWKVLDVATGGGHVAKKLAPHVYSVTASDLTAAMLSSARAFIGEECRNVQYVRADSEHLPFLEHAFDLVTCRIAAHHFPNPRRFVVEAARVLKPGGRLLLIDNIVPGEESLDQFINKLEFLRDESHVRCCTVDEWEHWFHDAGFDSERSRLRKKTFDYPTWVRRTARTEEQVMRVTQHILSADEPKQAYCGLKLGEANEILSIHIDEWMALLIKRAT